jgi:catechol 2,3-dioxygenase-like lactoylglutathione lyase family enzyme
MLKFLIPISLIAAVGAAFDGQSATASHVETPGIERISSITILVKDQEEALRWYTEKLGFEKRADNSKSVSGFRWLTVAPRAQPDLEVVLLLAEGNDAARVGKGTTTVLSTTDCKKLVAELEARGVAFSGGVEEMPWGIAANFVDLYGNPYHLVQFPKR